jgi:hypothetical protein
MILKIKFTSFLLFLAIIFSIGCSNDFDLIEDQVEIPVVYCMLDADAQTQVLRLEKAFASKEIAAQELAKDPNAFYYNNAVVKMTRTGRLGTKTFTLKEVDGNTVGLPRQDGFFTKTPNKLYTIASSDMPLEPGDKVKLEITTGEGSTITGETTLINKVNSTNPRQTSAISFSSTTNDIFRWTVPESFGGKTHSLALDFNFTEVENGKETKKTFPIKLSSNTDKESFTLNKNEFYTILGNGLTKSNTIKRFFNNIDYYIYSGDKNLSDYLRVSTANTGITGSGETPTYSNLSKGLGLFGSRATLALKGLDLSANSKTLLKESEFTKALNFQ